MCGIGGIFDFYQKHPPCQEVLKTMMQPLLHRGPDDEGYFVENQVGLGFKRLAIIDLTTGNQPLFNEDRSLVSVCNGEIYNFKELKSELESKGHQFYTHCDVEVLNHLYEEEGVDFVKRLNGQFAFAIFDKQKQTLFLARDHVGIAPLFYMEVDGVFLFASEIKALLNHPLVQRRVNLQGLDQMLSFPGVVSPTTMFQGIHALKPGHWIKVEVGKVQVNEYWDLEYPTENVAEQSEESYVEQLEALLLQSIRYRMIADVPVGFYLSGGLDSSLVAAMIHELFPEQRRHSFSIGFEQNEIDERRFQQLLVEQVNSYHHEIVFDWQDISSRLQQAVYCAETPLKECYNTCSLALSENVHRNGMKVILTGEGSDELFAGYVGYRFDEQRTWMADDSPYDVETLLEEEERKKLWGDKDFFYEKKQYEFRETKLMLYSDAVREQFADFNSVREGLVDHSKLQNRPALHRRSYLDFKLRMSDHLLADHGDRVAYANSVEARYPFLDINLIEYVKTIPPHLKLNGLVEKYILKKMSRRHLPQAIVDREKFAFVAPGSPYLIRQNIEWINDLLSYETIRKQGYFDPDTIERLKKIYAADGFKINMPFDSDLLIVVLTFGIFLEQFNMPNLG